MPSLTLIQMPNEYAICRLSPDEPVPAWVSGAVFWSIARTSEELSVLCPAAQVPEGVRHESGWRLLKLQGPFAFTETGILTAVLNPLAEARIGILAQSTFDTDYVLVKADRLTQAREILVAAGHTLQS